MRRVLLRINSFAKGLILFLRPGVVLSFLIKPLLFISNLLSLSKWITKHQGKNILNDFFSPSRDHSRRFKLYEHISERYKLDEGALTYLEFGVYKGASFTWWAGKNKHSDSRFYGFDTFEGLPEKWGTYDKGEMHGSLPGLQDNRSKFIKGLFQDTLFDFLEKHNIGNGRRIIHLDADLFSSTLFVLTTLARHIKKGDILIFDEFNVPNHEYFAFKVFTESFYVRYELIGAVNNYYQCAFRIL